MATGVRRRSEDGAALIEFAFVIPILALFLFGIVQFGIAYDKKQSINASAREGARTAAIPTNNFTSADAAARGAYEGLGASGDVTVRIDNATTGYSASRTGTGPAAGDAVNDGTPAEKTPCGDFGGTPGEGTTVTVQVEIEHTLTIPFMGAPDVTISGTGEFRCEAGP